MVPRRQFCLCYLISIAIGRIGKFVEEFSEKYLKTNIKSISLTEYFNL